MGDVVKLAVRFGEGGPLLVINGRGAWTLSELIRAGEKGVTPRERPAPRWSAYVRDLRLLGIAIDTIEERHDGPFKGWHGRYRLACELTVVWEERA